MKILGISGNLRLVHEDTDGDQHDAAAVLIVDGKVAAAIEEERLNRIKHTDKFPINAIEFVLRQTNTKLEDLDQICYYSIQGYFFEGEASISSAEKIKGILDEVFGYKIDKKKIYFVYHHLAHAVSTFYMSGYDKALVLTIDGTGDGISGLVLKGEVKKHEPFTQIHKDIAAALQESLEEIVMHVLKYYKEKINHSKLCLAGGVAHNCTLNGKILYSGLFEDVFVQPAAHDAGCALGAALYRYYELYPRAPAPTLEHLYWGTPIPENDTLLATLECWKDFISYERIENITRETAKLLAEGAVIGWVQGKSEFGPRALGNRSIVADPRPANNKDIINEMVKKREAYRPFAPSVLEEYVDEYYEIPFKNKQHTFPYMIFVVKVKEKKQKLLGAVTHVDGTARIQTVSRQTNPRYWELIEAFRKITGVPVILNTSFNNNAEPIVDSVNDAIVCFYTTKLNYLVIGDYLIKKKDIHELNYLKLIPSIPVYNVLIQTNKFISLEESTKIYQIKNNFENGYNSFFSSDIFRILDDVDSGGHITLGDLMENNGTVSNEDRKRVMDEIMELWGKRFIRLNPQGIDKEVKRGVQE